MKKIEGVNQKNFLMLIGGIVLLSGLLSFAIFLLLFCIFFLFATILIGGAAAYVAEKLNFLKYKYIE